MEYFMRNNDNWQMERLTRQVDDNDERRKKQREDQQAAVVRDAELRRKGPRLLPTHIYTHILLFTIER